MSTVGETDIRRLRLCFATGDSRFFRQTCVFSNGRHADFNRLFLDLRRPISQKKAKDREADSDDEFAVAMD